MHFDSILAEIAENDIHTNETDHGPEPEGEIKSAKRGKLLIKSTKKEGGSKFKKIIKLGKSDNKRSKSTSEKSKF